MARDALVITGATATGKTALSITVANALAGEVVSMDSRQVYRGMDIGTAKVGHAERRGVPHHGLDVVDPDERYSAGRFARDARRWIDEIRLLGHTPMLVGGTGFFLRALTRPLFEEPPMDPVRRRALGWCLDTLPDRELRRWARVFDPREAGARGPGGRQRLARAIEVALLTGHPLSWWHVNAPAECAALRPLVFVLELPRPELYARIDARVRSMIDAGLVDEVAGLLRVGHDTDAPGMSATGYAELVPYIRRERTLEAAIALIQAATRRYARRQITWFRHQLPRDAIRLDAQAPHERLVEIIDGNWRREECS